VIASTGNRALVVLPTYNERENIESLIRAILSLDSEFDVLVVDDNSPDGTGDLVASLGEARREVSLIRRPRKLGLGTAYLAGFRHALERDYAQVVTMDADFSHSPEYLPALRELGRGADLAIGSRYVSGGGAEGWPVRRKIISGTANFLARTVLSLSTHDCTAGFRCYKRDTLLAIDPGSIRSSGYSFLIEMLYRVEKAGLRVREMPIVFVDRKAGSSKISRSEVYKSLYTLARLRFPSLPWSRIDRVVGRYSERGLLVASVSLVALTLGLLYSRRRR
jgi:glycosyltransferase involved in cell wall biosynthesis